MSTEPAADQGPDDDAEPVGAVTEALTMWFSDQPEATLDDTAVVPAVAPDAAASPEPEPAPQPDPVEVVEARPEPEPEPVVAAAPASDPVPEPVVAPAPEPEPAVAVAPDPAPAPAAPRPGATPEVASMTRSVADDTWTPPDPTPIWTPPTPPASSAPAPTTPGPTAVDPPPLDLTDEPTWAPTTPGAEPTADDPVAAYRVKTDTGSVRLPPSTMVGVPVQTPTPAVPPLPPATPAPADHAAFAPPVDDDPGLTSPRNPRLTTPTIVGATQAAQVGPDVPEWVSDQPPGTPAAPRARPPKIERAAAEAYQRPGVARRARSLVSLVLLIVVLGVALAVGLAGVLAVAVRLFNDALG